MVGDQQDSAGNRNITLPGRSPAKNDRRQDRKEVSDRVVPHCRSDRAIAKVCARRFHPRIDRWTLRSNIPRRRAFGTRGTFLWIVRNRDRAPLTAFLSRKFAGCDDGASLGFWCRHERTPNDDSTPTRPPVNRSSISRTMRSTTASMERCVVSITTASKAGFKGAITRAASRASRSR